MDDPTPGPEEVVVQVEAAGICGTDLHIFDGAFAPTPYPIVPGHEFAGRVAAQGTDVDASFGDQLVAVDPSLFCGRCRKCRSGRGNLCDDWGATGDTVDGAFAEYVAVPADNIYTVAGDVDAAAAALVEPLSCAVHAIDRPATTPGDRTLLYGAGTMGLLVDQPSFSGDWATATPSTTTSTTSKPSQKRTRNGRTTYRARITGPDRRERSKTFRRKVDAERWLRDQQHALATGPWIDPAAGKTSVGEWAATWLDARRIRPSTMARDESYIRNV